MNSRYNKILIASCKFDEFLIHFGNDLFSLINNPNLKLKISFYRIQLDAKYKRALIDLRNCQQKKLENNFIPTNWK